MVAVIVRHKVKDFDAWKPLFDEHGEVRRRDGALGHQLYRVTGDPQDVIIVNEFKDASAAQAFLADSSLREVMDRAGVISAPDIAICEQNEVAEYSLPVA